MHKHESELNDEERKTLEWVQETYQELGVRLSEADNSLEARAQAISDYLPDRVHEFGAANDMDPNIVMTALMSLVGNTALLAFDSLNELYEHVRTCKHHSAILDLRTNGSDEVVKAITKLVGD